MCSVVRYPEAVVVEMHDRPCVSSEDAERVMQTLYHAGREQIRGVIDCYAVESIGATFLATLSTTMQRLGARVGDIVMCNLQPVPLHIFQLTKMDRLFPTRSTRKEALLASWPLPNALVVVDSSPAAYCPTGLGC